MLTNRSFRNLVLSGAGVAALLGAAPAAYAQEQVTTFSITEGPLSQGLLELGRQARISVAAPRELTAGRTGRGVQGELTTREALVMLLDGSGLTYDFVGPTAVKVDAAPQSGSAAAGGAEVEALIVTAQKREEDIQDVPIAISAFTQKDLEQQKIEGGFDLLKAIPNVTFSKNNFSSYNFSIRGIGTKAVSATTDPGVAVSFNNIALIQNRLFEQEYFDVERVEVLRGPQGTLYGRNATAGVINIISAKPDLDEFEGWLKGEVGNYDAKRLSAMVNIPLVNDKLAIRIAGALTDRQGYDYNLTTKNAVNGRDLWSARVTIGFEPAENFRGNLIWERFEEDDNRSRTGKQLCHRDDGPDMVGSTPTAGQVGGVGGTFPELDPHRRSVFSYGCKPGSLYDPMAFGTPNLLATPLPIAVFPLYGSIPASQDPDGDVRYPIGFGDPYAGKTQSADMREIESIRDPVYRAKADVVELNLDWDLTSALTLSSQTVYNEDQVYSFQDFNRFNTAPFITDTSNWTVESSLFNGYDYSRMSPGGVFCDPQIGCSNAVAAFDISQAKGRQFAQEFRLQSDFDGNINFSIGANYTRFQVVADYYVFNNILTILSLAPLVNASYPATRVDSPNGYFPCNQKGYALTPYSGTIDYADPNARCVYIDPNPVESIDGEGHNYFRSKNPYKLKSAAAFGELYWNIREDIKVTAGLRYTDDRKTFIPVPSQLLLGRGGVMGGAVNKGYPEKPAIKQHWGEWTGRLGVDWQPELSFTDQTLLYAFYSRGYKGGGANPPHPGYATLAESLQQLSEMDRGEELRFLFEGGGLLPILELPFREYADIFRPEFVNAFEVGAKNTLIGGALTLNASGFFYDYTDYQVSQIRDRTAVNENFDATVWGLEFEAAFAPTSNFRMIANLGYLDTKVADGMKSLDITDRTQGNPNYVIAKPWVQYPSNCVVPVHIAESWLQDITSGIANYFMMCTPPKGLIGWAAADRPVIDHVLMKPYDVDDYPELNGGVGIFDDISGNELPNSPHWTMNVGAQYGIDVLEGWRVTLRGDAYWQSQSWARIYNRVNDKLHGWYNANLSLWIENGEGLKIELYAKNILDEQPITDAFINSDDTALTTNVFTLDPRLIGLSIRQEF